MIRSEAVELISTPGIMRTAPQIWYDVGCGSGTFTLALADLLSPGSIIHAFDKDEKAFGRLPNRHREVEIRKAVKNLADSNLHLGAVDGILLANFLHFIPDESSFPYGVTAVPRHPSLRCPTKASRNVADFG